MPLSSTMQFISDILSLSLKPNNFQIEENILPVDRAKWDEFIPLVTRHSVGGLLFYWVRKLKLKNSLPPDIFKCLKLLYESFAKILEDHRETLKKILMRFYESEIEIVLLKGAQLGHTDYPDFSLRPMEDIDLLVKGSNKLRIINLMLEMGFNLYHTGETCDKFFIRNKQTDKPIFIEIHSDLQVPIRLDKSFSVDMDEFWNDTQIEYFDGFPFRQLHPTYNLIYLCTHLGEHHFSRLIWGYDIALLIHRHGEEIDWKRLEYICRSMKIRNSLYHSLSLCRELFQVPIPEKVLKNLSPSCWKRKIGHFLIRGNLLFREQSRVNRFEQILIKIFLVDSWMEAILWFLFPTKEWIKQRYSLQNTREIYTYYLLHPLLYLIKAIKAPMR